MVAKGDAPVQHAEVHQLILLVVSINVSLLFYRFLSYHSTRKPPGVIESRYRSFTHKLFTTPYDHVVFQICLYTMASYTRG